MGARATRATANGWAVRAATMVLPVPQRCPRRMERLAPTTGPSKTFQVHQARNGETSPAEAAADGHRSAGEPVNPDSGDNTEERIRGPPGGIDQARVQGVPFIVTRIRTDRAGVVIQVPKPDTVEASQNLTNTGYWRSCDGTTAGASAGTSTQPT